MAQFTIYFEGLDAFKTFTEYRELRTLERLIRTGSKGCTPINEPDPRWSADVHDLRKKSIYVETRHEKHGSVYPGNPARDVLKLRMMKGGAL